MSAVVAPVTGEAGEGQATTELPQVPEWFRNSRPPHNLALRFGHLCTFELVSEPLLAYPLYRGDRPIEGWRAGAGVVTWLVGQPGESPGTPWTWLAFHAQWDCSPETAVARGVPLLVIWGNDWLREGEHLWKARPADPDNLSAWPWPDFGDVETILLEEHETAPAPEEETQAATGSAGDHEIGKGDSGLTGGPHIDVTETCSAP